MGRAPCCEKTGLKKGPWTAEEDRILINFIIQNGHQNWRALPKQAGLLRCGKSCRLRWMNYLRPDIKRGDFTQQEEEIIIQLHAQLGNKWSAIAARLSGRTDNEIKNVWHTHLKKRVDVAAKYQCKPEKGTVTEYSSDYHYDRKVGIGSPEKSLNEVSSVTTGAGSRDHATDYLMVEWPDMGERFWSELVFQAEEGSASSDLSPGNSDNQYVHESNVEDDSDFWRDVFIRAEELTQFI